MFLSSGSEHFHLIWQNFQACLHQRLSKLSPKNLTPIHFTASCLIPFTVSSGHTEKHLVLQKAQKRLKGFVWCVNPSSQLALFNPPASKAILAKYYSPCYVQSLLRHLDLTYGCALRRTVVWITWRVILHIQAEILIPAFNRASIIQQWHFMQQDLNKWVILNIFTFLKWAGYVQHLLCILREGQKVAAILIW